MLHHPHGARGITVVGLPQAFGLQPGLLVLVGPVGRLAHRRAGRARVDAFLAEVCADRGLMTRRRVDGVSAVARAGLIFPRRARREPTGMDSKTRRRTERLDVLLLGLALPRRHGRAAVVLDHGAKVTCERFRRYVT